MNDTRSRQLAALDDEIERTSRELLGHPVIVDGRVPADTFVVIPSAPNVYDPRPRAESTDDTIANAKLQLACRFREYALDAKLHRSNWVPISPDTLMEAARLLAS